VLHRAWRLDDNGWQRDPGEARLRLKRGLAETRPQDVSKPT
jgi:hypothetical protein